MSEKALRRYLTGKLKAAGWHVQNIEDSVSPGVPDLNACRAGREIWVELKYLDAWPKRANTGVTCGKGKGLKPEQALWLTQRARAGGVAWVVLQVGRERLAFHGRDANWLRTRPTQAELRDADQWAAFAEYLNPPLT